MAILQEKPVNTQNLEYLQKSNCGYIGNVPNVCCPSFVGGVDELISELGGRPTPANNVRPTSRPTRTTTTTVLIQGSHSRPFDSKKERPTQSSATDFGGNSYLLPTLEYCGISSSNRIIGGERAELDEFPWMALLEYRKRKVFRIFVI